MEARLWIWRSVYRPSSVGLYEQLSLQCFANRGRNCTVTAGTSKHHSRVSRKSQWRRHLPSEHRAHLSTFITSGNALYLLLCSLGRTYPKSDRALRLFNLERLIGDNCMLTSDPTQHHSHSRIHQPRATDLLPAPVFGKFVSIVKFVNDNVIPLAGLSGGFVQVIRDSIHSSSSMPPSGSTPAPIPLTSTTLSMRTRETSLFSHNEASELSLDDDSVVEELRRHITTFLFAESMEGIKADVQLFLAEAPFYYLVFSQHLLVRLRLRRTSRLEDDQRRRLCRWRL